MHKCNVNVLLINFSFFIINIADDTGKKKTSFNTETIIVNQISISKRRQLVYHLCDFMTANNPHTGLLVQDSNRGRGRG